MSAVKEILQKYYGIAANEVKKLAGYDNINYLIKSEDSKYIFKTYKWNAELYQQVVAESEFLTRLTSESETSFPLPIATDAGKYVEVVEMEGIKTTIRLLSFLEGEFFAEAEHTPALFRSFGQFLANMDLQLAKMSHATIRARQFEWDIQYVELNKPFIADIDDPARRKIVEYFLMQFESEVRPKLPLQRKSIIHNDANEWNVLVQNGKISGIIDFGDIAYSQTINELAVGITYAVMGKDDPIDWACHIIEAYHETNRLMREEVDLLYYLVAAQLCISVCNSAHSKKLDPENEYISISEKPAWDLLHRWLGINPEYAKKKFRECCGMALTTEEPITEKVDKRHKLIDPIVSLSYGNPIYMQRAAFQYMYDGYGNTFLDAYNNIPHVGHSHPKVVEAGQKQMAILNTNTRYVYDLLNEYAERLLRKFPDSLNKVYFVNSGSASSDLALRLARHHTGSEHVMVMEHGYHGHTLAGIDISDYKFSNKKGPGQKPWILKAPIPDTYRGKYQGENVGKLYADEAIQLLQDTESPVGAFIAEPIVGCGGQVPLATGYLKYVYPAIKDQGGVCISDEVQTGFGRLGRHFWGFEAQEVIPDIVVLGKPMGNGHPMGAVVTTTEIAESFGKGVEFFSSFGGNPVSCATGLAVLEVIEEEGLQRHASETGEYYMQLMCDLQKQHSEIGDVRGSGLFLGFEIVDEQGKENTALAANIKNELRNRNILISTDGPKDNVLKSKPPLCFTRDNVLQVVEEISDILKNQ